MALIACRSWTGRRFLWGSCGVAPAFKLPMVVQRPGNGVPGADCLIDARAPVQLAEAPGVPLSRPPVSRRRTSEPYGPPPCTSSCGGPEVVVGGAHQCQSLAVGCRGWRHLLASTLSPAKRRGAGAPAYAHRPRCGARPCGTQTGSSQGFRAGALWSQEAGIDGLRPEGRWPHGEPAIRC